jgi:hypothetical protein
MELELLFNLAKLVAQWRNWSKHHEQTVFSQWENGRSLGWLFERSVNPH